MTYQVEFKQSAKKELARLQRPVAEKIVECVKTLANNPRPDGCKKLKGAEQTYRSNSHYEKNAIIMTHYL